MTASPSRSCSQPGPALPPATAEAVLAMLRARGGRITATRRITLEVLLAGGQHRHMSADEIAAEVRDRLPEVAESSIYRTLAVLEELGVVTHVHLGHGPSTFHLRDQIHRHLVCQRCRMVIEVPGHEFVALTRRLEQSYGFAMSSEHFAILGECRACRSTARAEAIPEGRGQGERLGRTSMTVSRVEGPSPPTT